MAAQQEYDIPASMVAPLSLCRLLLWIGFQGEDPSSPEDFVRAQQIQLMLAPNYAWQWVLVLGWSPWLVKPLASNNIMHPLFRGSVHGTR